MTDTTAPLSVQTASDSREKWAYLLALVLVAILASNTALFGLVGLAMTGLALVPVMFVVLLTIMIGR